MSRHSVAAGDGGAWVQGSSEIAAVVTHHTAARWLHVSACLWLERYLAVGKGCRLFSEQSV